MNNARGGGAGWQCAGGKLAGSARQAPREELELALSQANTLEELVRFEKMVAVMKAPGPRAIDEAIRFASSTFHAAHGWRHSAASR